MAEILGIDLGTSYSAVAIWRDGAPRIIPDREGRGLTPSVVAVDPAKEGVVVGYQALAIAQQDPRMAVYSAMRYVGRRFDDEWVQQELQVSRIPYKMEPSRSGEGIEIVLDDLRLTPRQVSASILRKLKVDAEAHLGQEITEAVIAVPAYSDILQRQAIREVGLIAGFDTIHLLNAPTAAYLAFEHLWPSQKPETVAVYDLGGGTFDISILDVGRGAVRVRSTGGDTHLGGDDLDWMIVDWMLNQIGGEQERRLRQDVVALARLRQAAEQAKRTLSGYATAQVDVPVRLSPSSAILDLGARLTLAELEQLARPWIDRTLMHCAQALAGAELQVGDVYEVLLVGGQTRMPAVRAAVRDFFGIEPNVSVVPEEAVALGAAVYAGSLDRDILLAEATTAAEAIADEESRARALSGMAQAQKAQWTILVYMAANNDLDGLAAQDLAQILETGSTPQVNLLVLYDRPDGASRYVVGKPGTEAVEESLDNFNSGSPDTLLDTMRWAVEQWPAERYGLMLWSHGSTRASEQTERT